MQKGSSGSSDEQKTRRFVEFDELLWRTTDNCSSKVRRVRRDFLFVIFGAKFSTMGRNDGGGVVGIGMASHDHKTRTLLVINLQKTIGRRSLCLYYHFLVYFAFLRCFLPFATGRWKEAPIVHFLPFDGPTPC